MYLSVVEPFELGGRMRARGDELRGTDAEAVAADPELSRRCVRVADEEAAPQAKTQPATDAVPSDVPPAKNSSSKE